MAEEKNQSAEIEINNVKELDSKLAEALKNTDNKPSKEETEEAQKEFASAAKIFEIKSWDIGKGEKAQVFIDYMNHFVANRLFWTERGWMGVIKMDEELIDAEKFIKANPGSPLKLGYQALEFMFYSLQNPGGVGLQAARDFEEENDIYAQVFDAVGVNIAGARKELKDIQFLQDRYAAMEQGFYLEVEDGVAEEGDPPTDEASVADESPVEDPKGKK